MKKILVKIKGRTPLLMNNPESMIRGKSTRKQNFTEEPEVEAERTAYRNKDGKLYIPARCLYAFLINSAKGFKFGKTSAPSMLAGTVSVEPFEVILSPDKKFEVDLQRVVIQKNAIIKARAKLSEWSASFTIVYDETWIPNPSLLKEIVESGATRVGLLDFRPQKRGPYGTFEVVEWKETK